MVGVAPSFLALSFGLHIVMVNLGIGLAWLVPYLKWRADRGSREYESIARSLMRFYAATYGLAGVFGTAFTVFLLSYYPRFIGFAGNVALIPFGISILMIVLHFFTISAYWYGWYKWSPRTHLAIGLLMAVSATLIPLGFRAVFAFLNIPAGLIYDPATSTYRLDAVAALTKNPTFPPLYVKSIAAALTATFLVVAGAYAYRFLRTGERVALAVADSSVKAALAGLIIMPVLGYWYAVSILQTSPYKFNNIFANLGLRVGDGPFFDVSWLFALKMALYAAQLVVAIYLARQLAKGTVTAAAARLGLAAGFMALLTIAVGDYVNAFAQYPFFVAAWPDLLRGTIPVAALNAYGIVIPKSAVSHLVETVNSFVLLESGSEAASILEELGIVNLFPQVAVNAIAVDIPVVAITVVFLAALLAAAMYFLYVLLVKPEQR